jgi:lipopolysaccharide export system protein LptC
MNVELRRRYPALLLLAAGSLLAALSFWALEIARRSADDTRGPTVRTEPDYFIEDFTYTRMSVSGKAQYVISGKKLIHYPVDDSSTVEQPSLRSYSSLRDPMTLHSRTAKITTNQKELHFYGDVTLERPQSRGTDSLRIDSDYMLARPNQDIVKTDRKVVIQLGTSRMEGTGMIADNRKHQLNLQSRVSGHYEPSHK